MSKKRAMEWERMTSAQLRERLIAISYDLEYQDGTDAWVRRRQAVPTELRAIARELAIRGTQLELFG